MFTIAEMIEIDANKVIELFSQYEKNESGQYVSELFAKFQETGSYRSANKK